MQSGTKKSRALPASAGTLPKIGGIALKNGLILVSEKHWAAAIRDAAGIISVASGIKPRVPGGGGAGAAGIVSGVASGAAGGAGARVAGGTVGGGIPVVRGLGRFAETLLVLAQAKMNLPGAELPFEGGRILAALAASVGANAAVRALAPKSALIQEVGGALAAFIPAVVALKNSPISGYHGAEHKVIGGREALARLAATVRGAGDATGVAGATFGGPGSGGESGGYSLVGSLLASRAATKEHDRCGTNLLGPYLLATIGTNLLARGRRGQKTPAAAALAGAASLGIALEALRWATSHGDNILARLMLAPGRLVQRRFTTSEPTAAQLEVGQRAMDELLRLEGQA